MKKGKKKDIIVHDYEFQVRAVKNGYVIKDAEGELLYQDDDYNGNNLERLVAFLHAMAESVGYTYNKFGDENIFIIVDKGHKLDRDFCPHCDQKIVYSEPKVPLTIRIRHAIVSFILDKKIRVKQFLSNFYFTFWTGF